MMNYNIGDVVRLISVTEDDKLMGRYVGEEGIYQGTWIPEEEDLALLMGENENYVLVRFGDINRYVVNKNQLEGVQAATVETIFKAFNRDTDTELINTIKEYNNCLIDNLY